MNDVWDEIPSTLDEIEAAARAICEMLGLNPDLQMDEHGEPQWAQFIPHGRALIALRAKDQAMIAALRETLLLAQFEAQRAGPIWLNDEILNTLAATEGGAG